MPGLEEITAEFLGERFRFANADGDVIVGDAHANSDINGPIAIKGPADVDELRHHHTYRFYGKWSTYKNQRTGQTEQQFHFQTFVTVQPHNRDGIVAYLKHAGQGFGFGQARALALWEAFGSDAVQVFREEPERTMQELYRRGLPLSADGYQKMAAKLIEQLALENCTIELTDLLAGRGFPKTTARRSIQEWGNVAASIIRRDPYRLMRFRSCGFKKCDQLYLQLGLPAGRLKRQALSAWYALASNSEGHTWFPLRIAEQGIRSNIGGADLRIDKAIELATRGRAVSQAATTGIGGPLAANGSHRWAAESRKAANELELAELVSDAMAEPCRWPAVETIENIDGEQPERLREALRGAVSIVGGSPGTGKTFCVANLIKAMLRIYGSHEIGIGAPTGKAAVRLTEVMQNYCVDLRARTWHSLLGVESTSDRDGWGFKHNRENPLPYKVLVGDETSMNDTDLMAAIFRARAKGTHVLLVGDINQLPPVGHGAPLRDLIAAGLPYGELRQIRRNSGGIVEACAAIRDGIGWTPGDNLKLVETGVPAQQVEQILAAIKWYEADGLDPIWDCQVLAAVNAKSPMSRKELNKVLQAELNHQPGVAGQPFRLGDKVVNLKNGYYELHDADLGDEETQTNERGEVYVANGELGEVVSVDEKATIVRVPSPRRVVRIPRTKATEATSEGEGPADDDKASTGCNWDLAYCLSVHKSQGSEFPLVIVVGDEYAGARRVCSREWLYTGISRAKKSCLLVGRKPTFDAMCRRVALKDRRTLLRERILLNQAVAELATM